MKIIDLLFFLLALTFFPLHEGILARTSAWSRVADGIKIGAGNVINWRNGIDARELSILERHFMFAAAVFAGLAAFCLRLPAIFIWASIAGFVSFFAWFAFRWSFNVREAVQQLAPVAGYSLIPAWAFLMIDYAGPKLGFFTAYAEKLWILKYTSYTPFQVAGYLFIGVAALLVAYWLFAWIIFEPFAWAVLLCLKGSRSLSAYLVRRTGHEVLFPVSVAIQLFGLVYLYVISRHL